MFMQNLKCEICENSLFEYSPHLTFEAYYSDLSRFTVENVVKFVDDTFSQYLVFSCPACGATAKYAFDEFEKIAKQDIKQKLMDVVSRNNLIEAGVAGFSNRVFVFCNGCSGFDGKGSCLIEVYKTCKLKKLPRLY